MGMSTAELEAFLAQTFPTPLGVIATVRRDGSPHIVPVWFRWDAGAVTIWTTETRTWVQNLLRDPRVAFSVQTFDEPYPAVMIRGIATVATADDAATAGEIRAITRRYIVPEDVEGYIARWPDLRTIVTIVPVHIVSWSGEDEILWAVAMASQSRPVPNTTSSGRPWVASRSIGQPVGR